MQAGDDQSADQQTGHPPKCKPEERIFIRVVVRGVRQVSGEFPMGPRVAFLTGRNNVIMAEVRLGIFRRQDIVRAVAILTFGGFLRAGAEFGHLSVIRVEIRFRDLRVTLAALIENLQSKTFGVGARDPMRGMAINAFR